MCDCGFAGMARFQKNHTRNLKCAPNGCATVGSPVNAHAAALSQAVRPGAKRMNRPPRTSARRASIRSVSPIHAARRDRASPSGSCRTHRRSMKRTRVVSLIRATQILTMLGKATVSACGRTIRRNGAEAGTASSSSNLATTALAPSCGLSGQLPAVFSHSGRFPRPSVERRQYPRPMRGKQPAQTPLLPAVPGPYRQASGKRGQTGPSSAAARSCAISAFRRAKHRRAPRPEFRHRGARHAWRLQTRRRRKGLRARIFPPRRQRSRSSRPADHPKQGRTARQARPPPPTEQVFS
jgi:hypothetical protein